MRPEPTRRPAWEVRPRLLGVFAAFGFAALGLGTGPAWGQTSDLVDRTALRVCADPANLPFSNRDGEGFENKLAELLGETYGIPVLYRWFPQTTGFIRNTLRAHECDIVMGYAQGHELVQNTNHYYRSAYVLLYRVESDLSGVESLDDERLQGRRLGIVAGTPPATIMALNGLIGRAKPYHLVVDRRFTSPGEQMVSDIAAGDIDAGILWGPIGGYYAKRSEVPITVVPLTRESSGPRMSYRITMGIRPNEPDWKHQLNGFIAAHQDEIDAILFDFGVPLLDERGRLIGR